MWPCAQGDVNKAQFVPFYTVLKIGLIREISENTCVVDH